MSEEEFSAELLDLVEQSTEHFNDRVRSVRSFRVASILTSNEGFIVNMRDGSQFQVTVVKSREATNA